MRQGRVAGKNSGVVSPLRTDKFARREAAQRLDSLGVIVE